MAKLKVYRTVSGFTYSYVAAPSKAAALRAWGSETDLFALGAAEIVTDEALWAAPLADPGSVIKIKRTATDEPPAPKAKTKAKAASPPEPPPKPKPKPRPRRDALDDVEAKLADAEARHRRETAEIEKREKALAAERRRIEAQQQREREKLEAEEKRVRADYDRAITRWRAAI